MIRYLKRNQIEDSKYNDCIEKSLNTRMYAYSWYLDIVADHWDVLVLDDYKAVMPLPWRSKFFIKYIYPPCWTQQLGVFSENTISEKLQKEFIDAIPNKFQKITMHFNAMNSQILSFEERVNYTLSLENEYESIHENYRKDRKDRLRKIQKKEDISLKEVSIKNVIDLFVENYQEKKVLPIEDYEKLQTLTEVLLSKQKGNVLGVFNKDSKLISGALFLEDHKRITYMFSASSLEGKKNQSSTLLLNHIIEKNANSNIVLDFEGSMISGIASFYKSFGAQKENYWFWQKRRL